MEENYIEHMLVRDIQTKKPYNMFPINDVDFESIKKSIKENGFREWEGIHVWHNICIDGHTRLKVATELGIDTIPVWLHEFDDIPEALAFTFSQQRDRRNLDDVAILECTKVMDLYLGQNHGAPKGGRGNQYTSKPKVVSGTTVPLTKNDEISDKIEKLKKYQCTDCGEWFDREVWHCPVCDYHWLPEDNECKNCHKYTATPPKKPAKKKNRSTEPIAKSLGTSAKKIQRTRTVLKHADEHTKAKVKTGDISINKAYEETQKKRRESGDLKSKRPEKSKIGELCKRLMKCGDDLTVLVGGIKDGSIIPSHPQDKSYFEAIIKQAPWFIILFHELQIDVTAIHNQIKNGGINYDEKRGISTTEKGSQDNIEDCIEIKP